MKKLFFASITIFGLTVAHGQTTIPDTAKKEFKNVIGLDATGLLRQFFNLTNSGTYYMYPYIISYKRIFKSNAIRVGIGGNYWSQDDLTNDSLAGKRAGGDGTFGLGFEHYKYLSKRWNLYFGIDAIVKYRYNYYKSSWTATHTWEQTAITNGYGGSPFVGVQFKINSRISIATESQYNIVVSKTKSSTSETPSTGYDRHSVNTDIATSFIPPTSIIFRALF